MTSFQVYMYWSIAYGACTCSCLQRLGKEQAIPDDESTTPFCNSMAVVLVPMFCVKYLFFPRDWNPDILVHTHWLYPTCSFTNLLLSILTFIKLLYQQATGKYKSVMNE